MPSPEQRSSKKSGLKQILGLSVAAHVVGIGGYQGVTRIQEEQRMHEAKEAPIRAYEAREQRREAIVERAAAEMEGNRLNLWTFIRDAATVEAEAADLPTPDRVAMQREFTRIHDRFHEHWQDQWRVSRPDHVRTLIHDLQYAFQGYNYYAGMKTINPLSIFRDRGGPCGGTTLAVLTELQQSEGIRDQLRVHYYPPGEHGESAHLAPTIVFEDDQHHLQEFDLTSARPAFPSGTQMTLTELVEGYAMMHHSALTPHDPSRWSQTTRARGGDGGFGFVLPAPIDRRPFPSGIVPFFSDRVFSDFRRDPPTEVAHTLSANGGQQSAEPFSSSDMESSARFSRRNFMKFQSSAAPMRDGEIEVGVQDPFRMQDWRALSGVISASERNLASMSGQEENYLSEIGRVVSLYQLAHDQAALERRVDPAHFAEEKLHQYRDQAAQWIQSHRQQLESQEYRSHIYDEDSNIFLTVLGVEAARYLLEQARGEADPAVRRGMLIPLLLSDQTRAQALPLFAQLPPLQQLYLMEQVSVFFSDSFVANIRTEVFFNQHDAFGDAYQEFDALFSDLTSRVYTDFFPEHNGHINFIRSERAPIRALSQLQEEIHTSAQLHGHTQAWENAVTLYSIETVRKAMDHMTTWPRGEHIQIQRSIEAMRPFFIQSLQWMSEHPELDLGTIPRFVEELARK